MALTVWSEEKPGTHWISLQKGNAEILGFTYYSHSSSFSLSHENENQGVCTGGRTVPPLLRSIQGRGH